MGIKILFVLVSAMIALGSASAYYNVTYLNTTVILNTNSSAHVFETIGIFVSNSSVSQYVQNRDAVATNSQLSEWQKIIYSTELTQHIVNIHHSTYGFTFLPGPLIKNYQGGTATLAMSYYVNNVTTISNIAPRKFEYTFNDSVFNFENTGNGEALPAIARLNIIVPNGSQIMNIYPVPDAPTPSYIGTYSNDTVFSWFSGEPLSQFSLSFVTTESLQQEVNTYISSIYRSYSSVIYALIAVLIVALLAYLYLKSGR